MSRGPPKAAEGGLGLVRKAACRVPLAQERNSVHIVVEKIQNAFISPFIVGGSTGRSF